MVVIAVVLFIEEFLQTCEALHLAGPLFRTRC